MLTVVANCKNFFDVIYDAISILPKVLTQVMLLGW